MQKVFIDVGSHIGSSIDGFYTEIEDAAQWKIFAFEPLRFDRLIGRTQRYNNVKCIKAVVGVEDKKIMIFPPRDRGEGGTILKGKTTGIIQYQSGVLVEGINFVRWFKENIGEDDFVIIKMNIEGGEYPLLPELPKIIPQVAGFWIKFHHLKFKLPYRDEMLKLYNDFKIEISKSKSFIFCDDTEKLYEFKWLVEKAREKQS